MKRSIHHFDVFKSEPAGSKTRPKRQVRADQWKMSDDNLGELMDFFNKVAGCPLYNDNRAFLQYLALCCGSDIQTIYDLIYRGEFQIVPGMLLQ
jgi:hypothetical protein